MKKGLTTFYLNILFSFDVFEYPEYGFKYNHDLQPSQEHADDSRPQDHRTGTVAGNTQGKANRRDCRCEFEHGILKGIPV